MAYRSSREYLQKKNEKLQSSRDQFAKAQSLPQIFKSCQFYINGFTSAQHTLIELTKTIASHGGRVVPFPNAKITCIIATQMCDQKIRNLTKIVVKPEWIFDSIQAGKMLSFQDYRLFRKDPFQKDLHELGFVKKNVRINAIETIPEEQPCVDAAKSPEGQNATESDVAMEDQVRATTGKRICTEPNFIQSYFKSSRLHHLSEWKYSLIHRTNKQMISLYQRTTQKITKTSVIAHVDMDCFFVAVMARNRPDIEGKAVVVSHGSLENSTADVASCNYKAREYGLSNGMSLGKAKGLCKDLVVLPYDFDAITECTNRLYNVFTDLKVFVKAVSCDEAYLDITELVNERVLDTNDSLNDAVLEVCEMIRFKINESTLGCTASIGVGNSMLLARLATNFAKPNGVFILNNDNFNEKTRNLSIDKFPKIGYHARQKLNQLGKQTCGDCQSFSKQELQTILGQATGTQLYNYIRGVDDRHQLENKPRQSVGAEINWGIRLETKQELLQFLGRLALEVWDRMKEYEIKGDKLVVNVKKRNYVGEPKKYLGCGHCIDYAKTINWNGRDLSAFTKSVASIVLGFKVKIDDIRGVGIHVRNERDERVNREVGQKLFDISKFSRKAEELESVNKRRKADFEEGNHREIVRLDSEELVIGKNQAVVANHSHREGELNNSHLNPSMSQIDLAVLEELPLSIQQELLQNSKTNEASAKELSMSQLIPTASQIDPSVLKMLPKSIRNEQLTLAKTTKPKAAKPVEVIEPPQRPTLFTFEDEQQINTVLSEWIQACKSEHEIQETDLTYVSDYLCQLIDYLELEKVQMILVSIAKEFGVYSFKGKCALYLFKGYQQLENRVSEKLGSTIDIQRFF